MRPQLRCSPRTMFDCIQSSRDTQPERVAENVAPLSSGEWSAVRRFSRLATTRSVPEVGFSALTSGLPVTQDLAIIVKADIFPQKLQTYEEDASYPNHDLGGSCRCCR